MAAGQEDRPHFLTREHARPVFSKDFPVALEIDSGEVVTFETDDTLYKVYFRYLMLEKN